MEQPRSHNRMGEAEPPAALRHHDSGLYQPRPVIVDVVAVPAETVGDISYVRHRVVLRHCEEEGLVHRR